VLPPTSDLPRDGQDEEYEECHDDADPGEEPPPPSSSDRVGPAPISDWRHQPPVVLGHPRRVGDMAALFVDDDLRARHVAC
jgi:hypothetical protein